MRARAFYLLLLSLLSPVAAQAQANGIVGSWSGSVQLNGATYWSAVVFQPDGRFSEQLRMGTLMTLTTGRYEWLDRNTIHLTVEDWEPKQQCFAATGCHPVDKPPGGREGIAFGGPDQMSLQDLDFGGPVVTYRRTR